MAINRYDLKKRIEEVEDEEIVRKLLSYITELDEEEQTKRGLKRNKNDYTGYQVRKSDN